MAQVNAQNIDAGSQDWQEDWYARVAKAVYQTAAKEKWSQEKIFEMLQKPREFEKYYTWVSQHFPELLQIWQPFLQSY